MGKQPGSIIIVGAGGGVGLAVARRFARHGAGAGLIARSGPHLAELSATLQSEGVPSEWAAADARQPEELRSAIRHLAGRLGPAEVLCYSPLPAVDLIRPVLETGPEDLMASLSLSVGGAAAAVAEVVPAMIARGSGSLLFTTGSGALRPHPGRAASAVATTAESTYVALLHEALKPAGIRVAQLAVVGPIGSGGAHEPADVAEALWAAARNPAGPLTVLEQPSALDNPQRTNDG